MTFVNRNISVQLRKYKCKENHPYTYTLNEVIKTDTLCVYTYFNYLARGNRRAKAWSKSIVVDNDHR